MKVDKNHKCKIHIDLKKQAEQILRELTNKKYCINEILTILNLATVECFQNMTMQEIMQRIKIKVLKGMKKTVEDHGTVDELDNFNLT